MKRTVSVLIVVAFAMICTTIIILSFPQTFFPPKTIEKVAEYNGAEVLEIEKVYAYYTTFKGENDYVVGVMNVQNVWKTSEYKAKDALYENVLVFRVVGGEEDLENFLEVRARIKAYDLNGKAHSDFSCGIFHYPEFSDIIIASDDAYIGNLSFFVIDGFSRPHCGTSAIAFRI